METREIDRERDEIVPIISNPSPGGVGSFKRLLSEPEPRFGVTSWLNWFGW